MYGLTRATITLLGAAVAGFLLWLASQFSADELGEYWVWLGLFAAAGLAMALSQLLGGWTRWGWPRVLATVFLLGFLPAVVAGGLVLLARQRDEDAWGAGWAGDLGVDGLAEDLSSGLPAIAFALGLLLGFTFDTTGPRERRHVAAARDERTVVRRDAEAQRAEREVGTRPTAPPRDTERRP